MNDYTLYKIKKITEDSFYKLLDFIFWIPQKLYKENKSFKAWIDKNQERSSKKRNFKNMLDNIFYVLDKDCGYYQKDSCVVYTSWKEDYMDGLFDRADWQYEKLLKDESWIERNKLNVKKYTLREYMTKFHPNKNFVVYGHNENRTVLVIKRQN